VVVFAKEGNNLKKGDYADIFITECTAGTLIGKIKEK
jgi:hypothetical protein